MNALYAAAVCLARWRLWWARHGWALVLPAAAAAGWLLGWVAHGLGVTTWTH